MNITAAVLSKLISEPYFTRGREYANKGLVKFVSIKSDKVIAHVRHFMNFVLVNIWPQQDLLLLNINAMDINHQKHMKKSLDILIILTKPLTPRQKKN